MSLVNPVPSSWPEDDAASAARPNASGKLRRVLLRLLLVAFGIAVGLGLCEIIMRNFQLGSPRVGLLYHDRIYKLPPHAKFMNYDENTNLVETNNFGFHDHERAASNDNYRILFLGDSFLEGRQVKTDSLFTSQLEKQLSQNGQKVEVINGGVPGTGTAYQYVLWKEFFEPQIKVDHVVLCFFLGNDLVDNNLELKRAGLSGTEMSFYVDSQGNILDIGEKPGRFKKAANYLRDHSVLFNTSYEAAYRVRSQLTPGIGDPGPVGEVERGAKGGAWEAAETGTLALIKRWKAELAGKKMPFDIVLIDRPGKVYNRFEQDFLQRLQAACLHEEIGFMRLRLGPDPFELYSFDGIRLGHFNEKGHQTTANELYEYLTTRYPAVLKK